MSAPFDDALLRRAAALRERLVAEQLSKYNLQAEHWQRPDTSRPVILVPGQVESDASILFGAPGINRNMELLRAVRASRPEAHIVYKPHPDVVAGLREQGKDEARAGQECDEIVTRASVVRMLPDVDEVHLLTSLTGFEALVQGQERYLPRAALLRGLGSYPRSPACGAAHKAPYARRTRRWVPDSVSDLCKLDQRAVHKSRAGRRKPRRLAGQWRGCGTGVAQGRSPGRADRTAVFFSVRPITDRPSVDRISPDRARMG